MLFEQPGLATFFISPCVLLIISALLLLLARKRKSIPLIFFFTLEGRGGLPVLVSVKITKVCSQITLFLNNSTQFLNNLMSSVYSWQRDLSDGVPEWKLD